MKYQTWQISLLMICQLEDQQHSIWMRKEIQRHFQRTQVYGDLSGNTHKTYTGSCIVLNVWEQHSHQRRYNYADLKPLLLGLSVTHKEDHLTLKELQRY